MDILYLEQNGLVYAKGFFNQEGLHFYVLPGFENSFEDMKRKYFQEPLEYTVEIVSVLP